MAYDFNNGGSDCELPSDSMLVFWVNGIKVEERNPNPDWTLLHYLRYKLRLCGTKEACGEGGCGACTVMVSKIVDNRILNMSVNACLYPLCSAHGTAVVTTEGIGNVENMHPVQERIAKSHGSQCGYCTPGFVMSMYTLLRNNNHVTMKDMEDAFQGNLCRCTGYRPIIEGFKSFTCGSSGGGCCMTNGVANGMVNGGGCCREKSDGGENPKMSNGCCRDNMKEVSPMLFDESEFKPYDKTKDPIFPPELKLQGVEKGLKKFSSDTITWYRADTLEQLLQLKETFPQAKIIGGNTEIGVEKKFRNHFHPVYIHVHDVKEMIGIQVIEDKATSKKNLVIGAATTLTEVMDFCEKQLKETGFPAGSVLTSIKDMLTLFAGQQIRNVATLGGNIATASPISDMNPLLMAVGASVTLVSLKGTRVLRMDDGDFFISYRKSVIRQDEVIKCISIPLNNNCDNKLEYVWGVKQSRRRDDDIAIVNAGMRVKLKKEANNVLKVEEIALAYGGLAAKTVFAKTTMSELTLKGWDNKIVEMAAKTLTSEDFNLEVDAPGGMVAYRCSLAPSFFFKFFLNVNNWINEHEPTFAKGIQVNERERSAIEGFEHFEMKSSQMFEIVGDKQPEGNLFGRPIVHLSGLKHATGEAVYTDDEPPVEGELYGYHVISTVAAADLLEIDPTEALKVPGVVAFFDSKSIPPDQNYFGPIEQDEQVFPDKEITCQGQRLGFLVANDSILAERAAKLVKVKYVEKPAIVTIEDAIKANSYYGIRTIKNGNLEEGFAKSDHVVEGEVRIGGQEHFYLEMQTAMAIPHEDNEMELLVATQGPCPLQSTVSKVLGVPANRVKIRCRRMGGAFGGKETRAALNAMSCAIAAKSLRVPVRTVMNRSDDMNITGGRHPMLCRYKIGFDKSGKIHAMKADIFSNGGNSLDTSVCVMEKCLLTVDAGYTIPNWESTGYVCRTNLPSNTAYRGYGGPQGCFFMESMLDVVVGTLGKDPVQIRTLNMKKAGDKNHYGWCDPGLTLPRCWEECLEKSDYYNRKKRVDEFNEKNRWKKRGITLMPMKHDIGFHDQFMNQGGALVMIYTDGSVSLNHGGTEMGQGLTTKMLQVASRALGCHGSKIYMSETQSDKVPNAFPTCGSMSSDLNGMAVMYACQKLAKRLEPFKAANPKGTWEDWVMAAHFARINLSAVGFHELENEYSFSKLRQTQNAWGYTSYGAACSEVEIDCLTGDHNVIRTDIVMDVGESINPAVDIGQIEGAFVQGYGLYTLEEILYTPDGKMITKGPGAYKLPSAADIPKEFYVSLLRGAPNPKAVYSSKAIGEPPLFLSCSIILAIKEAIKAHRKEEGHDPMFRLDSPCTAERIRMGCQNLFNVPKKLSDKKPWAVVV